MNNKKTYSYFATVVKVVDGDTVVLNVDLGFYMQVKITARLAKINAPEGKDTPASHFLALNLPINKKIYIEVEKTQEKYGRWLITIYDIDAQNNIIQPSYNSTLLENALAEKWPK